MAADASDSLVYKDNKPRSRLQIGWCEYKNCGRPAYYTINFDCDDITADLCDRHHTDVINTLRPLLPGFADCEGDE